MAQPLSTRAAEEASLKDLFSDLSGQVQRLVRDEMELAKIETKEQLGRAGKAGAMFGAAGVLGFLALLLVSFAAAWGLAELVPPGVAFLVVGLLAAGAAVVLAAQGRKQLAAFSPVPEETLATVRDDVQVAKRALARGASGPPRR